MSKSPEPRIGDWYHTLRKESFEIVAIDHDDATIEVQYFDGTIEEWDMDIWSELAVSATEQAEDWSGSLDISPEDYGVDLDLHYANTLDILNVIDRDF